MHLEMEIFAVPRSVDLRFVDGSSADRLALIAGMWRPRVRGRVLQKECSINSQKPTPDSQR